MKSVKLISSVITMLFCIVVFGQDTVIYKLSTKEIDKNKSVELPKSEFVTIIPTKEQFRTICSTPINKYRTPIYILNGKIIDDTAFRNIHQQNIESLSILKNTRNKFSHGRNPTVIIKTKITEEKKATETTSKLIGTYKIEFKYNSNQKNGYITFNDSVFTMKNNHFLPYDGKVEYTAVLTTISSQFESEIIIDFKTQDIEKDTINFQVHDRKSAVMNHLEISVNEGKMIRVKEEETKLATIKTSNPTQTDIIKIGSPSNEENQPLYVVDGIPINYEEFQKIDPNTIESINILKKDNTNLFCSGRQNVIIITTKKLSKRELRKMKKKRS